jgi:hypothetical protein
VKYWDYSNGVSDSVNRGDSDGVSAYASDNIIILYISNFLEFHNSVHQGMEGV